MQRSSGASGRAMIPVLAGAVAMGSLATLVVLAVTSQLKFLDRDDGPVVAPPTTISADSAESTTSLPATAQESIDTTTTTERPAEVYVSPAGIDEDGRGRTAEQPVLTVDFALALALPGDTVFFAPGRYGRMIIDSKDNLRIVGEPGAVFHSDGYAGAPGIHVYDSTDISLDGVSIEQALWGLKVERTAGFTVVNSIIRDVGQEGILVSGNSSDIEIAYNLVSETGKRPGLNGSTPFSNYGEGIYLGTGGNLADGSWDQTTQIWVHHNEISFTTAEAIDIKPSVTHVQVADNIIHDIDTANSGAVVVAIGPRLGPDPDVIIERNMIFRVTRTSPWRDGNAIVLSAPATVRDNVMWDIAHYGIYLDFNLKSENPGSAVVYNNLVLETGLQSILDSSLQLDAPVEIVISENLTGSAATDLVGEVSREADVAFGQAMIDRLIERASALAEAEAQALTDAEAATEADAEAGDTVPVATTVLDG